MAFNGKLCLMVLVWQGSALDKPALMVPKEQSLETLLMSHGDATVRDAG